jgi:hypothetical protein
MAYRNDRDITRDIAPYRRMLAHVTPNRGSAEVSFRQTVDLGRTLPWLKANSTEERPLRLLHVYLAAAARVLHERPRLNRYCTGTRFFQRDGVWVTVSAKKSLDDGAKVVMLKIPLLADDTPHSIQERLAEALAPSRRGEVIAQEKEFDLFLALPDFMVGWAVSLAHWLDRRHWLPGFLVDPDGLFTSMVVANLGSVGLDAAGHHLYEWGNCPLFVVIGRIDQDRVEVQYTFDERVEDGLYCALSLKVLLSLLEDPEGSFTAPA